MRSRLEYAFALVALIVGAAALLLLSTRTWQTITTPRPRPFADDVLNLTGRTVDAAPTALALVGLAGVVAVIASRGWLRRVIGGLVALAGAALIWRCAAALGAVNRSDARGFVHDKHPRVQTAGVGLQITAHPAWGALSLVAAVLVLVAGLLIAGRGARWGAMSARYERPGAATGTDDERSRARADAALWGALERGEDPTAHDPQDAR